MSLKEKELQNEAIKSGQNLVKELTFGFIRRNTDDKRRNNLPSSDEIAAVFESVDGTVPKRFDVLVYPKNSPLRHISHLSSHVDPMVYPNLFPKGESGWIMNMPHVAERATKTNNKITLLQYYCHRIAIRNMFSTLKYSRKLSLQYIVDGYCKVESNRLSIYRNEANQKQYRIDKFNGLIDAIVQDKQYPSGKRIHLGSGFLVISNYYLSVFKSINLLIKIFERVHLEICNKNTWMRWL